MLNLEGGAETGVAETRRRHLTAGLLLSVTLHAGAIAFTALSGFLNGFDLRLLKDEGGGGPAAASAGRVTKLYLPRGLSPELTGDSSATETQPAKAPKPPDKRPNRGRPKPYVPAVARGGRAAKGEGEVSGGEAHQKGEGGQTIPPVQLAAITLGRINEAKVVELIGQAYREYRGSTSATQPDDFAVRVAFRVESNGGLTPTRVLESSGSPTVDRWAVVVVRALGESKPLGSISSFLPSGSARFSLSGAQARLTVMGTSPDAASAQALCVGLQLLKSFSKPGSPLAAELLSNTKVSCEKRNVVVAVTLSRQRAAELMKNRFGSGAPGP
jgi:hypothetical protein